MLEMVDRVSGNMGYIGTEPGRLYRMGPRIKNAVISGMPPLTLEQCKEKPLKGLTIYGKSEQTTTTGAQLWEFGDIEVQKIISKNFSVPLKTGKYTITADVDGTDTAPSLVVVGKKSIFIPKG